MAGPCKTYGPQFALQDIECPGVDEMPKLRGCQLKSPQRAQAACTRLGARCATVRQAPSGRMATLKGSLPGYKEASADGASAGRMCKSLLAAAGISLGRSWGNASSEQQLLWTALDCDCRTLQALPIAADSAVQIGFDVSYGFKGFIDLEIWNKRRDRTCVKKYECLLRCPREEAAFDSDEVPPERADDIFCATTSLLERGGRPPLDGLMVSLSAGPGRRPPEPRLPAGQTRPPAYFAWHSEPSDPTFRGPWLRDPKYMGRFDYIVNFHRQADVIVPPHLDMIRLAVESHAALGPYGGPAFPPKPGNVSWFCNVCGGTPSGRRKVAKELIRLLHVDSFGLCHNTVPHPTHLERSMKTKRVLLRKYKFDLAFENAIEESWTTEKIFHSLAAGAVPIYLGHSSAKELLPPRSALFVSDFPTVEALAARVRHLLDNETAYAAYHEWRRLPLPASMLQESQRGKQHFPCKVCRLASRHRRAAKGAGGRKTERVTRIITDDGIVPAGAGAAARDGRGSRRRRQSGV